MKTNTKNFYSAQVYSKLIFFSHTYLICTIFFLCENMLLLLSFEISKKNYFHYIKNHFFYEKFQRADVIIFNIFIFTTKSFERGDKKSTKFFLLISNQKARVLTLQKKLKNEYLQERGEKPTVTLFGGSPN